MSNAADMTMTLAKGLTETEQEIFNKSDPQICKAFWGAGYDQRITCIAAETENGRQLNFVIPDGKIIATANAKQFFSAPDPASTVKIINS